MKQNLKLITELHQKTSRDYLGRVTQDDKAACATVAKRFGQEYWDGDRKYGFGGYRYDGRWERVARRLIEQYGLTPQSRILDVGCGKGFLLFELRKLLPGVTVRGIDISTYAIENAKPEVREFLQVGDAKKLDFPDRDFDLVFSINTLHNLYVHDLAQALREIARVSRKDGYVAAESYRNEREKANLLYWQLTCEIFFTPAEWVWFFGECGYAGDYEFIFFE